MENMRENYKKKLEKVKLKTEIIHDSSRIVKIIDTNGTITRFNLKSVTNKRERPLISQNGYQITRIGHQNKYVHRLVWESFIGEIPEGMEIDHINSNRLDNRLENLQLVTKKENLGDPQRHRNIRKAKNKRAFIVIDGERIEKHSQKVLCKYINENFNLDAKCHGRWWGGKIAKSVQNRVTDIGYII